MWKRLPAVWLVAAAALATAGPAHARKTPDWTRPSPKAKLIGNVYWVGVDDLSTFPITTPQGHRPADHP